MPSLLTPHSRHFAAFVLGGVALAAPATAQDQPADNSVIELSPFYVDPADDDGYLAASSLAGGRLNTPLADLASSVSVMTRQLLDDLAVTDFAEATRWMPSAVPRDIISGPDAFADYAVSVRGFPSGFMYRNYFISYVNPDSYVTERVESSRGPNALVFGDTKAGGAMNVMTKQARLGSSINRASYRYNSEGGPGRLEFDVNLPVLSDQLAIRVSGLVSEEDFHWDYTGIEKEGLYGTLTYRPFASTTIRIDAEYAHTFRSNFGVLMFDGLSLWDGTAEYSGAISGAPIAGTSRQNGTASKYLVYSPGSPSLGVVNFFGYGNTVGSGYQLDTSIPAYLPSTFPLLRDYRETFRFGNQGVDQDYSSIGGSIEHRLFENTYVDVGANYFSNFRTVDLWSTGGIGVDINRLLPGGATNPNFGKRFGTADAIRRSRQGNMNQEYRAAVAHVLRLSSSEHRFLIGGSYRRDRYRDRQDYAVDTTNPNYRGGNPFLNGDRINLRLYEDQLGSDWSLPASATWVNFSFFPGQDKDLLSTQAAVSSSWFEDGRLKTLFGIRNDKLRTYNVRAVTDTRGDQIEYIGRPALTTDFEAVQTINVGAVYEVSKALSLYANYAEGFDTSTAGFMIDPATGGAGDPVAAKDSSGSEVGARLRLLDGKINVSFAYYRNEQTNDTNVGVGIPRNEINRIWNVIDPTRQIPGVSEVVDYKGDGFELEVVANPTRSLRLVANFGLPETEREGGFARLRAYVDNQLPLWEQTLADLTAANDARRTQFGNDLNTIKSRFVTVANGRPLGNTFDYTANAYANYEVQEGRFKGLRLGLGVNAYGDRYAEARPTVATDLSTVVEISEDAFALFSGSVGYRTKVFGRKVDFQANVSNLFDQDHQRYTSWNTVTAPSGDIEFVGNGYWVQSPRRLLLTVKVEF